MINHPLSPKIGLLEVVCGPMFSGKSEELIRRLRRAAIARQEIAIFKPIIDTRYAADEIVSHNGTRIQAQAVSSSREVYENSRNDQIAVIGIDEVQFFDEDIVNVICKLVEMNKRVIIAGLDLDFRGIPFNPVPTLLAIADKITKLKAICAQCGVDAHFTQRLVNGQPAQFYDPLILIGAQDAYQARCRNCFEIDIRPLSKFESECHV